MQSPPPAVFHNKYQWEIWKNTAGKSARTRPVHQTRPDKQLPLIDGFSNMNLIVLPSGSTTCPGWHNLVAYFLQQTCFWSFYVMNAKCEIWKKGILKKEWNSWYDIRLMKWNIIRTTQTRGRSFQDLKEIRNLNQNSMFTTEGNSNAD